MRDHVRVARQQKEPAKEERKQVHDLDANPAVEEMDRRHRKNERGKRSGGGAAEVASSGKEHQSDVQKANQHARAADREFILPQRSDDEGRPVRGQRFSARHAQRRVADEDGELVAVDVEAALCNASRIEFDDDLVVREMRWYAIQAGAVNDHDHRQQS